MQSYIISLLAGAIYATGFPLWGTEHCFFLGPAIGILILFAQILKEDSWKKQVIKGLLFQEGLYLTGFYWIPATLTEFGQLPWIVSQLAGLIFGLFLQPYLTFFILLQRPLLKFIQKRSASISLNAGLLSILFCSLEYYFPQQFPAHVGHGWMMLAPYLTFAPMLGAFFYGLVSVHFSIGAAMAWRNRRLGPAIPSVLPMMIVLIVGLIFPIQSPPPTKSLNVRMVQPNIGNNMKLSAEQGVPNSIYEVFDRYKKLSLMPSSKPIDIIIWPETAYPTLLSSAQMQLDPMAIPQVIREVIESSQAPLIFGGYDDHASNDDWFMSEYNTAFLITAKKEIEHYHKVKLIPFGEGLPFGPLNPYLGSIIRNISFFAQGEKAVVFEKTPVPMLPIICYEVLFSDLVRHFLNSTNNKAQILVNLTNDSWYGDTSEPKQHLYLAKWRALEFQIPLIRSTNTGITSIIFPNGSESTSLSFGSINHLDIEVNLGAPKTTFYWRWGIWPSLILWMCVILLLAKFDSILLNAFQNPLSKDHVI